MYNSDTHLSLQPTNTYNIHILNINRSIGPFCTNGKVFETSVLHKTKLTYHGCIEPIYKTLHLVDHHIYWKGIDNIFIYISIMHKYQSPLPPQRQHNIYILQFNMMKIQI